jgi:hypothetical protein
MERQLSENTKWAIKQIARGHILAQSKEWRVLYFRGIFFLENRTNPALSFKLPAKFSFVKRTLARFTILARLLRIGPRCAIFLNSNCVIVSCGEIFRIDILSRKITSEMKFRKGMSNVLSFCRDGDSILFGDYFENTAKEPVFVYKRSDGEWKKVYKFEAGSVKHIHQILKADNGYYIATGDVDKESGIFAADLNFRKVTPLLYGNERYRTCSLTKRGDFLFYAGDSTTQENFIFKFDRLSTHLDAIAKINGPCIYCQELNSSIIALSTSVEPDTKLKRLRYLFSYKLAESICSKFSYLYLFDSKKLTLLTLARFKKDILPAGAFKFGTIQFANNLEQNDSLLFFCESLSRVGNKTFEIYSEEAPSNAKD